MTQPAFAFGNPVPLKKHVAWFDGFQDPTVQWDVLPDGQHFIARRNADLTADGAPSTKPELRVVVNWFTELTQRLPAR